MSSPDLLWALLGSAAALAAAAFCAWLLRGAGLWGGRPAAAVVGGVMGGVLLGGAVLGRTAPDWHERILLGGRQERAALRSLEIRQRAEQLAIRRGAFEEDAAAEAHARQREELASARAALHAAVSRRRAAFRAVATGVLVTVGFVAGFISFARGPRPRPPRPDVARPAAEPRGEGAEGAGIASAFAAALLFTTLPAAVMFAALVIIAGAGTPLALAAAGALGAGSILLVPARWTPRAGRRPDVRFIVAAALALGAAVVVAASGGARLAASGQDALALPALIAPIVAWTAGAMAARRVRPAPRAVRLLKEALLTLLAPAAIALAAVHLDFDLLGRAGWAAVWCLLLAVLAAGDGRWAGVALARRLSPRPPGGLSTIDFATEALGLGPLLTQAVFASWILAIGFLEWAQPAAAVVLASILIGPVLIEPLIGVYRVASQMLKREGVLEE